MKLDSRETFGAEIQYFRLEPEYWEKVIRNFKESGLRTVTTYVQWGTHMVAPPDETHPAGVLDFTGETDPKLDLMRFLALIEKYGLNLNFRCGPFCCNEMPYGGYPKFICMDDPSIFSYDYQNRATQGYWIGKREGSQPSYMHPKYLEWCRKWINEVDKIILPHLKVNGGCITMINLDNEISYIVQDSFLATDYNPVNVARGGLWHRYLTEKYSDISNVPFKAGYDCIEAIQVPRSVPETIWDDFAYYADWMSFKTWIMSKYIGELRSMHEANGITEDKVVFMTNFNPHLPEGVPTRMPDFEKATRGVVGYDFYRGTFMSYSGYQSMARVLKLMNNTVDYTFSAEFMAGTWNKVLKTRVSTDHMRFMARCALAQGCKAIDWFMFHDRDCWNDAPVSSHGHKRPNYAVLKETPEILFERMKNWDCLTPAMDVSIIYNLSSMIHAAIGDPMPCADNDIHVGSPFIGGMPAGKSVREYIGLFRLAEQNGIQAAAVDIEFSEKGLYEHSVAVLPGCAVISERAAKAVMEYAAAGNTLIITGCLPMIYENGKKCTIFDGISDRDNTVGSGKVVFLDQWLGQAEAEEDEMGDIEIFGELCFSNGVVPNVRIESPEAASWVDWAPKGGGHCLYVQPRNLGTALLHKSPDETILFVMNHYPEAHRFELTFKDPVKKLVCLTEEEDITVDGKNIQIEIDRKNCQIYRVE